MKSHYRFFAVTVLAAALALPSLALAALPREPAREKSPIIQTLQKIRKFLGISTHNDYPTPPVPDSKP